MDKRFKANKERQWVLVETARVLYQNDECQIDDNARSSEADDDSGIWVQAWVWVPNNKEGGKQC